MHPPMHMYTYMNIYTYPTHTRHTHKDRHKPVCALLGAGDTIKKIRNSQFGRMGI